ncbi:MAG TPA: hypothetical protein VFB59_00370 [Candidatus Saccharimonadales bacterium]|nr:hypothetical protein [Candidatus Saccharimonadales bacterium]
MNDNIQQPVQTNTPSKPARGKLFQKKALLVLVYVVLVALIGGLGFLNLQSNSKATSLETQLDSTKKELEDKRKELFDLKDANGENNVKKDQFQSVFLKNGQVYFGKITRITATQITLENIYYLQEDGGSLVKLGGEVHGPEDIMYIERVNVEFWENLKSDSEISEAIEEYESQNP